MVNSALVLKGEEGMFSTVDICAVDLYTGICNFLKAGAASTFIKRDHWVESITSESLAAGLVQQIDFETATRKLYHGDYLIMMTDGVLDALPDQKEEETMKEIIMDVHEESPKDFGRGILERVLGYSDYHARDDMTVLAKCAGQMAKGGAKAAKTDVCLSVTGLAGPGGGTEETPVGTVFMGCYCAGKTTVREFHFEGDRKSIRDQAVEQALTFICDRLRKYDR